jgi:hypothetical protein
MRALIAGEKAAYEKGAGSSQCPMCRTKVTRVSKSGRDRGQVIVLELKLRPKEGKAKGKEKA